MIFKNFMTISPCTSGYATMVHGRGCNPHRCTTTFANVEITSLWRHWWRHNSETIRDRQKRRPPRAMKSSELSSGENRQTNRQTDTTKIMVTWPWTNKLFELLVEHGAWLAEDTRERSTCVCCRFSCVERLDIISAAGYELQLLQACAERTNV